MFDQLTLVQSWTAVNLEVTVRNYLLHYCIICATFQHANTETYSLTNSETSLHIFTVSVRIFSHIHVYPFFIYPRFPFERYLRAESIRGILPWRLPYLRYNTRDSRGSLNQRASPFFILPLKIFFDGSISFITGTLRCARRSLLLQVLIPNEVAPEPFQGPSAELEEIGGA